MEIAEKTLMDVLRQAADRNPSQMAVIDQDEGVMYSYKDFCSLVEDISRALMGSGVRKGATVALWATNSYRWLALMFAVSSVGAIFVPIDPMISREELLYVLTDSEACAIFISRDCKDYSAYGYVEEIREVLVGPRLIVTLDEDPMGVGIGWKRFLERGSQRDIHEIYGDMRSLSPWETTAIMYTSGTTGKPKGVMLDHRGIITKSYYSGRRWGPNSLDKLALFFPLFHMFGNTCIALCGIIFGATLVIPSKTFDPERINTAIERYGCTGIFGSPSMILRLMEHESFDPRKWSTLKKGIVGGAPCPVELMKRLVNDLKIEGIVVGYGITEACSWVTMTRPWDPIDMRVKSAGVALECCEVMIVDPSTGEALGPGQRGEVCTRGFLMKGYHRLPAATASAIDKEGWFHTGDMGWMDERGYLFITGRMKDIIIRDNIEISPVELEEYLYQLDFVQEAQVVGVPHPEKGQEIAIFIKPAPDKQVDFERIKNYLQEKAGVITNPAFYRCLNSFPTTRSGKIQKYKLAQLIQDQ